MHDNLPASSGYRVVVLDDIGVLRRSLFHHVSEVENIHETLVLFCVTISYPLGVFAV